jgi:hypothetical protein
MNDDVQLGCRKNLLMWPGENFGNIIMDNEAHGMEV